MGREIPSRTLARPLWVQICPGDEQKGTRFSAGRARSHGRLVERGTGKEPGEKQQCVRVQKSYHGLVAIHCEVRRRMHTLGSML